MAPSGWDEKCLPRLTSIEHNALSGFSREQSLIWIKPVRGEIMKIIEARSIRRPLQAATRRWD